MRQKQGKRVRPRRTRREHERRAPVRREPGVHARAIREKLMVALLPPIIHILTFKLGLWMVRAVRGGRHW